MKKVLIICLAAMLIICACGKKAEETPDRVFEEMINFSFKSDFSGVRDFAPDAYWAKIEEDCKQSYAEIVKLAKEKMQADSAFDRMRERFGDDYKLSYEIVSKEIPGDAELDSINGDVRYNSDYKVKDVDAAIKYEVEITLKGSKDEGKQTNDYLFVRIDGRWYPYFDGVGFGGIVIAMAAYDFTWE